jgi:hypothetical protein
MILALVGLEDDLRFASLAHGPPEGAPEIAKAGLEFAEYTKVQLCQKEKSSTRKNITRCE